VAWVPSHQELRDHPKTRRAARRAGVSIPQMIGHLHCLWWWALDHAPDGDLGKYDAEDLADAAMWEGDPETLVKALRDCGPSGAAGFLEDDGSLHDWAEYGGRYWKRVAAGRKAAEARWHADDGAAAEGSHEPEDADALPGQCDRIADAEGDACGTQSGANAEERRGEESRGEHSRGDAKAASYPQRLFHTLQEDHGWQPPEGITEWQLHARYRALLAAALELLPAGQHQRVSMGVIVGFWEKAVEASGGELPSGARDHLGRLVSMHGGLRCLDAMGEALKWGAGVDRQYAEDPLAVTKYATSVLAKREAAA